MFCGNVGLLTVVVEFGSFCNNLEEISGDLILQVIIGVQWEPKMGNNSRYGYRMGTILQYTAYL